jgi:hypothetical protein
MRACGFIICLVTAGACAATATPEPSTTSSSTAALGNACTIQCNNASIQCNAVCDRNPRPNCEDNCDQRFSSCMQACGCPFSQDTFQTTFDHLVPTTTTLCVGTGTSGVAYRVYGMVNRTDDTRTTLQCDGTTTTSTVSSTFTQSGTCDGAISPAMACNPVNLSPGNVLNCP